MPFDWSQNPISRKAQFDYVLKHLLVCGKPDLLKADLGQK